MQQIKDSEYLAGGVLRRGRQPNPHLITGMLINESDPPKRSSGMERKRGPDGKFLPSGKTTAKKKTSGKKSKDGKKSPSKTPAKNTPKRNSKGQFVKGESGRSHGHRHKNPDEPETQLVTLELKGGEEVEDLDLALEDQQMMTLGSAAKTVAIGGGAFLAPGLIEVITKGKLTEKLAKLFAGKDKKLAYKNYAAAKLTINSILFGGAWALTRKGKARKYRNPILMGLGAATIASMVDVFLAPKKATDASARLRTVLGMPPVRPTAYPYAIDSKGNQNQGQKNQGQNQGQKNQGQQGNQQSNQAPLDDSSALDDGTDQNKYITVKIVGNKALEVGTKRQVQVDFDDEDFAFDRQKKKYLLDASTKQTIVKGETTLGNIVEYWEQPDDQSYDNNLGNVEELWVYDEDEDDGGDLDIVDEVDDFYSDDEAAYGGGSYLGGSPF